MSQQEAKCRFTISLTQDTYDTLRNVAGARGGGAYIEALLKKQFSNENNINSIVIRLDMLDEMVKKLASLIAILYPDKLKAFIDSDADMSHVATFLNKKEQ